MTAPNSAHAAAARHANAFDLIRVLAAFAVLYSHSYPLLGLPEPHLLGSSIGTLAVAAFFGLSGYLVCQSWERTPKIGAFALKRAVRILPGLFVASLFTVLVAGAIDTRLPLIDYLLDPETWHWFLSTASLICGVPSLPGVFEGLSEGKANGSLWTLRYEVLAYALLALIGLTGRIRQLTLPVIVLSLLATAGMMLTDTGAKNVYLPGLWRIDLFFEPRALARNVGLFFVGVALRLWSDRVPLSLLASATLLSLAAIAPPGWKHFVLTLAVPYTSIVLAYRLPTRWSNLRGWDISYGVYIYAWPIQQLASRYCLDHGLGWAPAFLMSVSGTLILALASWVWIEKPALGLKAGVAPRRSAHSRQSARTGLLIPARRRDD